MSTNDEIEPYRDYRVRVKIRRELPFDKPKPATLILDGQELVLQVAWLIDDLDLYNDEWAMGAAHGHADTKAKLEAAGVTWIASGDVEVLGEKTDSAK